MKNNNILINALCIIVLAFMCFGAIGDEAYAVPTSPATPITLVQL